MNIQPGSLSSLGEWNRALWQVDLRSVQRDPLLRFMPFLPILVGILTRIASPGVATQVQQRFGLQIEAYVPLIASYILLLIAPMITGMVVGFLLLDQKDDRTLLAMRVTPLSMAHYLAYRLAMPMVVSAFVTWLAMGIAGLAISGSVAMVPLLILASLNAPIMALALGSFADNKVQGFALAKALNIFMIAPVLAAFIPLPWQWFFGLLPTFWSPRLLWAIYYGEPLMGVIFVLGIAVEVAILIWFLSRFVRTTP